MTTNTGERDSAPTNISSAGEDEGTPSSSLLVTRRSVPPPPPSRRPPQSASSSGSSEPPPLIRDRKLPPVPSRLAPTPIPPAPSPPVSTLLDRRYAERLEREKEVLRADYAAQLERERSAHEQAVAQLISQLEEREAAFEARIEAARSEEQGRTEQGIKAARQRIIMAAHLALEDRQGLLRHLEEENNQLRALVADLEGRLELPPTKFVARPRAPSLPPDLFGRASQIPVPIASSRPPAREGEAQALAPRPLPDSHPGLSIQEEDDLTRLRGVGPVIARCLRQAGITRFEQIAAWSDEDIQRIAPRLGRRPNRIRKDGWVQAAQEQLKQVGRTVDLD